MLRILTAARHSGTRGWVETGRGAGCKGPGGKKPVKFPFSLVIHHEQPSQLTSLKKPGDAFLVSGAFLLS